MSFAPMSGFPDILIQVHGPKYRSPDWAFDYVGAPSDLLAAGICTADMLAPATKKTRRLDAEGLRFRVRRWFVRREGRPVERYKIEFDDRSADLAMKIPGAAAAMSAWLSAAAVEAIEVTGALERPALAKSGTDGNVIFLRREAAPAV